MAKYIIKSNVPDDTERRKEHTNAKEARRHFLSVVNMLSIAYNTKVTFRTKPLRGTIQVEIDGFYYYVELYKEA